jgi:hypothetical protein
MLFTFVKELSLTMASSSSGLDVGLEESLGLAGLGRYEYQH